MHGPAHTVRGTYALCYTSEPGNHTRRSSRLKSANCHDDKPAVNLNKPHLARKVQSAAAVLPLPGRACHRRFRIMITAHVIRVMPCGASQRFPGIVRGDPGRCRGGAGGGVGRATRTQLRVLLLLTASGGFCGVGVAAVRELLLAAAGVAARGACCASDLCEVGWRLCMHDHFGCTECPH